MPFRINIDNPVLLRDAPLPDAPAAADKVDSNDLLEKIADAANGWCKVKVVTSGAPTREGFVRSALLTELTEAEQTVSDQIDEKGFFRQIADAAERFGANQDYLFAVAVAESGLKNVKSTQSSAVGPFKFMPETWHGLVEKHGAERGITDADITDPGSQAAFAAIQSADNQAKLKSLDVAPTPAQIYCAHLLGIGAASALVTRDPTILNVEALRDGTDVVASNSGLLADKTVGQLLETLAVRLDPGVKKAAALAAELGLVSSSPGQSVAAATTPGQPPWVTFGLADLGIEEDKDIRGKGLNKGKWIELFIEQAGCGEVGQPWCAIWANAKLRQSGINGTGSPSSQSFRNHADFDELAGPALGAIAVYRREPPIPGQGHVGFYMGETATHILTLGGNENDAVRKEFEDRAKLLGYWWPKSDRAPPPQMGVINVTSAGGTTTGKVT
jgi:uncharacterized protein (TIGR02594 family)